MNSEVVCSDWHRLTGDATRANSFLDFTIIMGRFLCSQCPAETSYAIQGDLTSF